MIERKEILQTLMSIDDINELKLIKSALIDRIAEVSSRIKYTLRIGDEVIVTTNRGYNNTTATAHASGDAINVYRLASRYRWGGYAKITGSDVDFDAAGTITLITVDTENSSYGGSGSNDWFGNGFYVGDIIKVGNDSGSNGTFDSPKYYKIKTIFLR